eukprot:m.59021 g.59021  ORF g.59021 m.59021 type:complete len:878 (-) comp7892_c0_seq1:175-2808(-)
MEESKVTWGVRNHTSDFADVFFDSSADGEFESGDAGLGDVVSMDIQFSGYEMRHVIKEMGGEDVKVMDVAKGGDLLVTYTRDGHSIIALWSTTKSQLKEMFEMEETFIATAGTNKSNTVLVFGMQQSKESPVVMTLCFLHLSLTIPVCETPYNDFVKVHVFDSGLNGDKASFVVVGQSKMVRLFGGFDISDPMVCFSFSIPPSIPPGGLDISAIIEEEDSYNCGGVLEWYQLDRSTNTFFCLETMKEGCSSPNCDLGFQLCIVAFHAPECCFQRLGTIPLPEELHNPLQTIVQSSRIHLQSTESVSFDGGTIQMCNTVGGSPSFAVQCCEEHFVYSLQWGTLVRGSVDLSAKLPSPTKVVFFSLDGLVLIVYPGLEMWVVDAGSFHEPMVNSIKYFMTQDSLDLFSGMHLVLSSNQSPMSYQSSVSVFNPTSLECYRLSLNSAQLMNHLKWNPALEEDEKTHYVHTLVCHKNCLKSSVTNLCFDQTCIRSQKFLSEVILSLSYKAMWEHVEELVEVAPFTTHELIHPLMNDAPTILESNAHFSHILKLRTCPSRVVFSGIPSKELFEMEEPKQKIDTEKKRFSLFQKGRKPYDSQGQLTYFPALLHDPSFPTFARNLLIRLLNKNEVPSQQKHLEELVLGCVHQVDAVVNDIVAACHDSKENPFKKRKHIFNSLEQFFFVIKMLGISVPKLLRESMLPLAFQVLPRALFLQYVDAGIIHLSKDFISRQVLHGKNGSVSQEMIHFLLERISPEDRADIIQHWDHPAYKKFSTQQLIEKYQIPTVSIGCEEQETNFPPLGMLLSLFKDEIDKDTSIPSKDEKKMYLRKIRSSCVYNCPGVVMHVGKQFSSNIPPERNEKRTRTPSSSSSSLKKSVNGKN